MAPLHSDADPARLLSLVTLGALVFPGEAVAGSHQVTLNAGISVALSTQPHVGLTLGADWRVLLAPEQQSEDWEFVSSPVPATGLWSRLSWWGDAAPSEWSGGARGGVAWDWCCGEERHVASRVTEGELGVRFTKERPLARWGALALTAGPDVRLDCAEASRDRVVMLRAGVARTDDWEPRVAIEVGKPLLQVLTRLGYTEQGGCWSDGRPCRTEGPSPRLPRVAVAGTVDGAAAPWLRQGRDELASVATFLRLRAELAEVEAPLALQRRAQAAAVEEVGHALMCFHTAARQLGRPVQVAPFLAAPRQFHGRRAALRNLALESLLDGWINEGGAARRAQARADAARDDGLAHVHATIAHEERGHAVLGADLAGWAIERLVT